MKAPTAWLWIMCAALATGCGSTTDVLLECPSPGGSTTAVLFVQFGGGAAGWADYVLALQPADRPAELPRTFRRGSSVDMLDADDVRAMTLEWRDDGHLVVESAFDSLTTVSYMFHGYPFTGYEPAVRVLFNEREPTVEDRRQAQMTCRTAGREIVNPPIKRLD